MSANPWGQSDPRATLNALADLSVPFAIRVAATLRVADHIASGVDSLDAIAAASDAKADTLGRLLRYLVQHGLFTEPSPGTFGLTEIGRQLIDEGVAGRRAWFDMDSLGYRMDMSFAGLLHSVRTGEPAYSTVHQMSFWDDLNNVPGSRQFLDDLMQVQHDMTSPDVAALYPWDDVNHVVDVGGGNGTLIVALLTAHPHLRGTVVDQPGPAKSANERFQQLGIATRAQAVVGDFFGEFPLPEGADVYTISRVLTDWHDEGETTILRRCGEVLGSTGRILIVEVLPVTPFVPYSTSFDLEMLATVGGRERDVADHEALANAAGLRLSGTWHGRDGLLLVELRRAD
jgi:2,7-dihydroxy-5-methyl-1-naphthoate 7-O-methyltransferase